MLPDSARNVGSRFDADGNRIGADHINEEIEISLAEQRVQTATLRKVNEVMSNHPEESLMVLRKWFNH